MYSDAARIRRQGIFSFGGCNLEVVDDQDDVTPAVTAEPIIIEATGIQPGTDAQFVDLFFENERLCGGGPTTAVDYDAVNGVALVTYAQTEGNISSLMYAFKSFSTDVTRGS